MKRSGLHPLMKNICQAYKKNVESCLKEKFHSCLKCVPGACFDENDRMVLFGFDLTGNDRKVGSRSGQARLALALRQEIRIQGLVKG